MIKDMETTIALTVIKATVAMEDMTTLGTTIPITDMGRDTQITVVNSLNLLQDNNCMDLEMGASHMLFCNSSCSEGSMA